jgi:hypothetical protein
MLFFHDTEVVVLHRSRIAAFVHSIGPPDHHHDITTPNTHCRYAPVCCITMLMAY